MLNNQGLKRCREDIAYFAKEVIGVELWSHQLEFMTNKKRIVVVASARQIGKSTACAVKAIHTAFSKQAKVLVVSPSLRQSGLMFGTIRELIGSSELLRGSLVDDTKTYIKLSNGSELWCLPDSPAQIRGFSKVSTVIVDEANFCSQELLRAVQYSLLTIPDSQLFMISSPWSIEHWFYRYFQDGQSGKDPTVASFHYTYEVSPLIQKDYVERMQDKITEEEYKTEILGEWIGDQDAYFDYELVESCVADYPLLLPEQSKRDVVWGGIDWASRGMDATVVMLVGTATFEGDQQAFIVPYFEAYKKTDYMTVIDRVGVLAKQFYIVKVVSETNGIGDMPTQLLQNKVTTEGIFTTAQNKVNGYGRMKILMQSGKLILPREPELIKQLTNLRYTISESGASMNISHSKQYQKDDYCDALMFALLASQGQIREGSKNDIEKIKQEIKDKGIKWRNDPPELIHFLEWDRPITAGLWGKVF